MAGAFSELSAQKHPGNDPIICPVKPPYLFAGSFGELRPNHFHSGLDFRTQGQTGMPVFAVKDGYVSRVGISPTGYGNALYMNHSDGTTSVYGHLERFHPKIQKYVR
jgi:murein DD-endopeptidase MepM/ murein hydrolase activator NlpD